MSFILKKNYLKRSIPILIILVIIFSMQQLINYLTYDYRGPSGVVVNVLLKLGLEEEYTRMILWYVCQVVLTFIFIKLLVKKSLKEIGFNFNNLKMSFKYIVIFFLVYPVLFFIVWMILKSNGLNTLTAELQNKSFTYIIKDFLSYGLFPGIGEEPLFRVFIIQFLANTVFNDCTLSDKKTKVWLIVLSSLFFSLGHIFISWSPLYFKFNVVQFIVAFTLGIFYALVYLRTKSIIAPIACHNYSDFIYRLATFLLG